MFKITSTQPINWSWARFALVKGENTFPSRQSVPAELWPKLRRFRELKLLDFESEFDKDGKLVAHESDAVMLEQLTALDLYAMNKDELAKLAEANKVDVKASDATVGVKKKDLLDALVAKLPKPPEPEKPAGSDKAEASKKAPGKPAADTSGKPVTASLDIKS